MPAANRHLPNLAALSHYDFPFSLHLWRGKTHFSFRFVGNLLKILKCKIDNPCDDVNVYGCMLFHYCNLVGKWFQIFGASPGNLWIARSLTASPPMTHRRHSTALRAAIGACRWRVAAVSRRSSVRLFLDVRWVKVRDVGLPGEWMQQRGGATCANFDC